MKNPPFAYLRPSSLTETLEVLAASDGDAKILAGGQSLVPLMALRLAAPAMLVDIARVPGLDSIEVTEDGTVTVGALVSHAVAEDSPQLAEHAPLVAGAMSYVGHRAIRNRGTVCGSVAHGDPAAEMPAVMLATGAVAIAESVRGRREIAAAELFRGYLDTALEHDELLVAVRFPPWRDDAGGAIREVARRHGDYALVGTVVELHVTGGEITDAALSYLGVASTPSRVAEAEAALLGRPPTDDVFADAARIVSEAVDPPADIHATSAYRRHLAGVLATRGLRAAADTIGAAP